MKNKKELTTKQQIFLENIIPCGGNLKQAAEIAGYAPGSYTTIAKDLRKEIIELAENVMAFNAPQAAMKVVEMVTSDNPVPQANVRLQAAQTLLDRVGLGKKDKLEVDVQNSQGLFILPAKEMSVIDGEYEDAN
jgi:phage terminase small subunit